MDILDFLQSNGVISASVAKSVKETMDAENSQETLESALLNSGVDEGSLRAAMAEYYEIPAYEPNPDLEISSKVLNYIAEESARHYRMMPLRLEDDVLVVAVNDPENLQIKQALGFVSSKHNIPYKFEFALESDLKDLYDAYENLTGEVDEALTSLESELESEIANQGGQKSSDVEAIAQEHIKEDAPVTKIVASVLRYAIDGEASDIHIEPTDGKVNVRFRVDGILQKSLELPKKVQSAVVARVKILASLRLDEKRKPQDGRFSANFEGRKIDFRVSILPTNHGEKVVMRILDTETGITNLEDTGISKHNLKTLREKMEVPFGIILISGPTGSGKSTTLYTMLNEMDRQTKNVLSLEDPVEYNIEGVSQSQVRPEIGYTFANGLRSALRQDPDVILVGEIRDGETAQLAIQAALTGHLVLSTIHTNNSIGVIARLVDMGIDPYLIAPTLKLAVAQRLSRRLCPGTGKEEEIDESFKTMIDEEFSSLPEKYHHRIPDSSTVMQPEPSPGCASGMKGRVAVMETLVVDDEIQSLILDEAPEAKIYESARQNGFMTMKEDAIIKALEHTIPFQEVSMFGTEVADESAVSKEYLPADGPSAEKEEEKASTVNSETIDPEIQSDKSVVEEKGPEEKPKELDLEDGVDNPENLKNNGL